MYCWIEPGPCGPSAQRRQRDEVEAERLTDQVGGHLAVRQRVLRKIPQRLLAARGLVDGGQFLSLVIDRDEKGVVAAQHELALELELTALEGLFKIDGRIVHLETARTGLNGLLLTTKSRSLKDTN